MSTPAIPVVPVATTSTFSQVKDAALEAVNWIGRQVVSLGSSMKDFALKVVEFVKPFFTAILKFGSEQVERIREFVVANKQTVSVVAGSLFLAGVLFLGAASLYNYCKQS